MRKSKAQAARPAALAAVGQTVGQATARTLDEINGEQASVLYTIGVKSHQIEALRGHLRELHAKVEQLNQEAAKAAPQAPEGAKVDA